MKKCRSTTIKEERCKNNRIPFSKYCLLHQDPSAWIIGTIIGLLVAILTMLYQIREPDLHVRCYTDESGDPSKINCEIKNTGRGEAQDIILSFNNIVPNKTKILASPEFGIILQLSENIADPQKEPELSKLSTAFIVKIPRISADDICKFTIATQDGDNLRAAKQLIKIRNRIEKVLDDFYKKISQEHPEEVQNFVLDDFMAERIKQENFFLPSKFSYEKGRFPINFINEAEHLAAAKNQDLYKRFKKEFIDVFRGGPKFKAPVLRILITTGESTYAIMPPYVGTYVEFAVPVSELKERGIMYICPPIPKSYD
jgi:hypothetical protein